MTDSTGLEPIPWLEDNWSRVTEFSQAEAFALNKTYRDIHGAKAREPATLHILTEEGIVSIAVQLRPIGNSYHIDAQLPSDSRIAGLAAMEKAAGERIRSLLPISSLVMRQLQPVQ